MTTPTAVPDPAEGGTRVELQGFSLSVGRRVLLQEAEAEFPAGGITLIVGCSGAGKSLLLRALAGLLEGGGRFWDGGAGDADSGEVRLQGRIAFDGREGAAARGDVGVVFQNFALFDELTPAENVRFAHAHRRRQDAGDGMVEDPRQLLDELQLPTSVRTSSLSGGQRQRLAIARTLAYQPRVLLYDEPTSGLDRATAARVARLIQTTHARHPQTSIIVTHDYASLLEIADRIYLLDAASRTLVEIPPGQWDRIHELLVPPPVVGEEDSHPKRGFWARLGYGLLQRGRRFFEATTTVVQRAVSVPWNLLPIWSSPRWGFRFLLHYAWLIAGPSAWFYLAVAGLIAGHVTTYFTFRFLPLAQYTEPLLTEELLRAMGFALYRILVPVLGTILIAARCGAAVASDVGGKVYGQQVDALRSFGVAPRRYLLTNILIAFLLGAPLLIGFCYLVASATSLTVFTATYPDRGPDFWNLHFHRRLVVPGQLWFAGTGWLLAKTLLSALGVGLIAYYRGIAPKYSSRDVSGGVTSTILWATLYVLLVQFVFAFLEF